MAITATVTPGTTPPSVTIVASGGVGIVERLEGTVATTVRGTDAAWVGTILDYEAPQQLAVAYRFAGVTTPLVEMPDMGVWLIPAGRPELAVQAVVATHDSWATAANQDSTRIPGRPNPVVVSWGARSGETGQFTVTVYHRDEELALIAALAGQDVLLLSGPAGLGLSGWMSIGDVSWSRRVNYSGDQSRSVTLPYTMQDRPEVVAAEAGHRWVDQVGKWSAQVGTWAQQ